MSKDFIVVFTKTNARVLVNPPEMGIMLRDNSAILNPELKHVKHVPPHFWKMEYGIVAPMNKEERETRIAHIANIGVDNSVITSEVVKSDPYPNLKGQIDVLGTEVARLRSELEDKNKLLEQNGIELLNLKKELVVSDEMSESKNEIIEDKMQAIMDMSKNLKMTRAVLATVSALCIAQLILHLIKL